MNRLLVIGAGGHGCVVAEVALSTGKWSSVFHLDDRLRSPQLSVGTDVRGRISDLDSIIQEGDQVIVAVGDNETRLRLHDGISGRSPFASIVAPEATLSRSASLGDGCILMPRSVVNAGASIDQACLLNTGSIIEHGVWLGRGVHVGPGAILGGDARIGARSLIGIGASVLPGVSLANDVILGAGAVAVSDIDKPGTYSGAPARRHSGHFC